MKKHIVIILSIFVFAGCGEDWLELDPSTALTPSMAFQSFDDAEVALRGVYNTFWTRSTGATYYGADIYTFGDVKGDDVRTWEPGKRTGSQYRYIETPESSTSGFWTRPYVGLLNVNAIIDEVDNLPATTPAEIAQKDNIRGQALALRALFHFDLVRIYGRLPENGSPSDLGVALADRVIAPTENLPRNTVGEIYDLVIQDFSDAIPLLTDVRVTNGTINSWGAKSLLARVYLYTQQYGQAFTLAEDVINNGPYDLLTYDEYAASWGLGYASEGIFEIIFNAQQNSDREGLGYLWDPTGYGAVTLTDSFIELMDQDPDDIRNSIILDDPRDGRRGFLAKYPGKDGQSERINNPRVIRLAEVYLIAAEAALKSGNQTAANNYIKALYDIRTNRDNDVGNVDLDRILLERRKELVGEGHRFFDLMRNGLPVIRTGGDHFALTLELQPTDHRAIQPIPQFEINANPNMQQNPGYAAAED